MIRKCLNKRESESTESDKSWNPFMRISHTLSFRKSNTTLSEPYALNAIDQALEREQRERHRDLGENLLGEQYQSRE